mgnify:FL=1
MRTIFTFLTSILFLTSIHAECAMSGLYVFPKGKTIRQNPVFVLDGYGFSEHTIEGLNKEYPVYLQCGEIKVPLEVKEMHKGQFELTQAVLVPTDSLIPGLYYKLTIDHLPPYDNFKSHASNAIWKVESGKDTIAPEMTARPRELNKILELYGCHPVSYVVFSCPAKDNSEMMVRATVKDKAGNETSYFIETNGLEIKIGHDMCHGAFKFAEGSKYDVKFDFMDASGNIRSWEGAGLRFSGPDKETSE